MQLLHRVDSDDQELERDHLALREQWLREILNLDHWLQADRQCKIRLVLTPSLGRDRAAANW